MDIGKLDKILKNEPNFRLKQVKSAIFKDLAEDWEGVKVLPQLLRNKLKEKCPPEIKAEVFSAGDAIKALFVLKDCLKIESVLMKHKDARPACNVSQAKRSDAGRNTVCVSSQVGCALCCRFCATGQLGFKRNLDCFEIVEQVLFFARLLKKEKQKITNVVFMGMGEPLLNYDNVLKAIGILNDKDGFNLGSRSFSISTVGIVEGIEKLADEPFQINLAVSLHAPDDKLREKIMPVNKKYPIEKILEAVRHYIEKTKRRVMFEYIMIKDINDSDDNARKLAYLLKNKAALSFVNLISYNPTGIFKPSSPQRIKRFKEILDRAGISVTRRYRFGRDIKAACGQLAG